MDNIKNAIQDFNAFAEEKLSIHDAELNTRYENMKPDEETLEAATVVHKKIFSDELDEKIQSMTNDNKDEALQIALQNQKQDFISRLNVPS